MPRKFTNVFELTTSTEELGAEAQAALRRLGAIPLWRKSWILRTDRSEHELRRCLNDIVPGGEWKLLKAAGSGSGMLRSKTSKDA